jgi:hypothetical protein
MIQFADILLIIIIKIGFMLLSPPGFQSLAHRGFAVRPGSRIFPEEYSHSGPCSERI